MGYLLDDEEKQVDPLILQSLAAKYPGQLPEMSAVQKYNQDYGSEALQAAEKQAEEKQSGLGWAQLAGGIGDALAGRDSSKTAANFEGIRKGIKDDTVGAFEKRKAAALADYNTKRTFGDNEKADQLSAREMDLNSDESKLAQDLALSMGLSPDKVKSMTAAQFKQYSPVLSKKYELEQKKLDRQESRDERRALFGIKQQERAESAPKREFDNLPEDKKHTITDLSKKNASKIAIANQIDAVMSKWDSLSEDQKVSQGGQLLKVLNSSEGADAIGAEEAKRLGAKLEYAYGNLLNSSPTQFGRNLPGFKEQADLTSTALKGAIKANQGVINQAYGRDPEYKSFDIPQQAGGKKVVLTEKNKRTGEIKVTYSDGTSEIKKSSTAGM